MEDVEKMRAKEGEKEEHGVLLEERPDYYVRKSKRAFWTRCILFPLACIAVVFAVYRFVCFINNDRQVPDKVEESSSTVPYAMEQGKAGKEGEVAKRLEKIYNDMLGDSRPYALSYLSSDFRRVMLDVLRAEQESGSTLLDHDLWTRTAGTHHTVKVKSVTATTDDRASAEVMVRGELGHYSNQESLVVLLLMENGLWMVDDFVTSYGSEKGMLGQKAEEVLSMLSQQESMEHREDVRRDAPWNALRLRGSMSDGSKKTFNMYLAISEGSVEGEYEIDGDGVGYALSGEIDGEGAMVLREYRKGVATGRLFEGRLEGSTFVGQYRNTLGTTTRDFRATVQ